MCGKISNKLEMPYLCVTGEGKYDKDDVDRKEFTLLGIVIARKPFENNITESSN